MQTFLPYPDFKKSAECLDYRRLGKQRVEAWQIFNTIQAKKTGERVGWANHPAVLMWEGFEEALKEYYNWMVLIWVDRGYKNTMNLFPLGFNETYPEWLGNEDFHNSHKSNLLRKDIEFYSQYNWTVPDNLEYVWPVRKKVL